MTDNFGFDIEKAEKEYDVGGGGSNDWYKFKEGPNPIRILSAGVAVGNHFKNGGYKGICLGKDMKCPGCAEDGNKAALKWLLWLIDGRDNTIKLFKMPHTIAKTLEEYRQNPQYAFAAFPMPYGITVAAKNAGTKEVEYVLQPDRSNSEIPADLMKQYTEKCTPPDKIKESMKTKAAERAGLLAPKAPEGKIEYPTDEINPDDIPF